MANILTTLGTKLVTEKNKQDKTVLSGLAFSLLPVPSVSGAMAPLYLSRKSVEKIAGAVAIYNKNRDLHSDDEANAAFSDICERMVPTLSTLLAEKGLSTEDFVVSVVNKVANTKFTTSKDRTEAAQNAAGRAISFSSILSGGEEYEQAVRIYREKITDFFDASMEALDAPETLRERFMELAEEYGVDLSKDRIKFKEAND
jgi:hypothetical protein